MKSRDDKGRNTGTGMTVLILVIAAAVSLIVFNIFRLIQLNRLSAYTDVEVDGTVTTTSAETDEELMEKYQNADPAGVVTGDETQSDPSVCVVFSGLNEDVTINEEILKILDKYEAHASFAVSAVGARENQGVLKKILESGNKVISAGMSENEHENEDVVTLLDNLSVSRSILNAESSHDIRTLCCPGMGVTMKNLKAAAAAGYDRMVLTEDNDLIDENTFESREDVINYVHRIQGMHIVVVCLDGESQPVHQEPTIVAATPAIDKQEGLDTDSDENEQEEKPGIEDIVGWLFDALEDKNITMIPLSGIKSSEASSAIRESLSDSDNKAVLYHSVLTDEKDIGLGIKNLSTAKQYDALRKVLKEYRASASFFLTADVDPDLAGEIAENGYSPENGGKTGKSYENTERMYEEIEGGSEALQDAGLNSEAFLVRDADCIPEIRTACFVSGQIPVYPQNPENLSEGALFVYDASDLGQIESLLKKAQRNDYSVDDVRTLLGKNGTIPLLSDEEMEKTRQQNNGEKAKYETYIPTTEKAIGITFGNIENEAVDLDVAGILKRAGGAGTFFVSFDEMRKDTAVVEKLIDMGQEIGILFTSGNSYSADYNGTAYFIHDCLCYMQWRYNYTPKIIMMMKEPENPGVLEAVHAYGLSAVGTSHTMILDGTAGMTEEKIADALDDLSNIRFSRGGLEYFNLSYYDEDEGRAVGDDTVMGKMVAQSISTFVDSIAFVSPITGKIEDGSRYSLKTISELLSSDQVYTLTVQKQNDVSMTKNVLTSMDSDKKRFEYMRNHYLGSNFIVNGKKMPGFSDNEISQMDKTGKLTNDKVLFLTFDDWGSDESVNKLLYVLDKYDVKATFFVLTEHVDSNPNLLRAVAAGGHKIASHSNSHVPLSDANKDYTEYYSLTEEEQKSMRQDLVISYEKLNKYVGDVYVDGKKALSLDFRPPTLEISKGGLYQVFDVGFLYSISGDVTTNDYKAQDLDTFIHSMTYGSPSSEDDFQVGNGSVIVMHMTENARYTAQMLDVMIPHWKKQGYSFARVDEYIDQFEP